MARDDAAHAEADEGDALFWAECGVDVLFEAGGDLVESSASVRGFEAWDEDLDAALFEAGLHLPEGRSVFEDAVDEDGVGDFGGGWAIAGEGRGGDCAEKGGDGGAEERRFHRRVGVKRGGCLIARRKTCGVGEAFSWRGGVA